MGGLVIETIRPGVQFIPEAAAAFRRAEAQVRAEFGRDIDANSTYRSWAKQMGMYLAWMVYVASGYLWSKYPGHSKAVHPSQSFHVAGIALDSDDWRIARIVQILADNGFIRNRLDVPNERHHFEYIRARDKNYGKPTSGGLPSMPKETKVKHYFRQDATAKASSRNLAPGAGFYLNTVRGAAVGKPSNVAGGIGAYSFSPHVYVEGKPGDVVEVVLCWQDEKTKPRPPQSRHYVERLVIDKDGHVKASREFKRAVASGFAVYVHLSAPTSNTAPVQVKRLDCDAYLFVVA